MWSSDDFYIVIFVAVIGLIFWDSISAFRKWRTSRRMGKAAGRAFSEFLSSSISSFLDKDRVGKLLFPLLGEREKAQRDIFEGCVNLSGEVIDSRGKLTEKDVNRLLDKLFSGYGTEFEKEVEELRGSSPIEKWENKWKATLNLGQDKKDPLDRANAIKNAPYPVRIDYCITRIADAVLRSIEGIGK